MGIELVSFNLLPFVKEGIPYEEFENPLAPLAEHITDVNYYDREMFDFVADMRNGVRIYIEQSFESSAINILTGNLELNYDGNGWHDVGLIFHPMGNIFALEVLPSDADYGWTRNATTLQLRRKDEPTNEITWTRPQGIEYTITYTNSVDAWKDTRFSPEPKSTDTQTATIVATYDSGTHVELTVLGSSGNMHLESITVRNTDTDTVTQSITDIGGIQTVVEIDMDANYSVITGYKAGK